jgi:tetratricopeptide (TPR) repeat protein
VPHLATLYYNLGKLDPDDKRAIQFMERAVSVARNSKAPRARSYIQGVGEALLRSGDPKQALRIFRDYNARPVNNPNGDPEARRLEGFSLAAMGDLHQALTTLEPLAAKGERDLPRMPQGPRVYRHIAQFLFLTRWRIAGILGNPREPNLGRVEEALDHCRRAVELAELILRVDPGDLAAKSWLSDGYLMQAALLQDRDPAKALENAKKAAEAVPSAAAQAEIADALKRLGKHDAALAALKGALELRPAAPETAVLIHHQLGDLLGDASQYQQALAIAANAVAEKPRLMPLRNVLADCYEKLGQFDKSLEVWKTWKKFGVSSPYNESREREAETALTQVQRP